MSITEKNDGYNSNASLWEFHLRSFLGGKDYQDGDYLIKYTLEDADEYNKRIDLTPIDNHCRNVVQIFSSFVWRVPPKRDLGNLGDDPAINAFLADADLDGRELNEFMRDAQIWASVYGHCWLLVDKPPSNAKTRAEELDQDIRPYIQLITPENVFDWRYERAESGRYVLTYLKVREWVEGDEQFFRVWTNDSIEGWSVIGDEEKKVSDIDNPLGIVPAVCLYAQRSPIRGTGISDIGDIALKQKSIYNKLSEIEQLIRITNHPSLVKTQGTDATAGAGAIIHMDDDLDAGLKPYLLQPSGTNLDAIRACITDEVEAINRMAHMGAVRATEAQTKSGVALQTEFQLLNARLSEKAALLELAEEQIWDIFAKWQGIENQVLTDYNNDFDLHDLGAELDFLQRAKASGIKSTAFVHGVDEGIAKLVLKDNELDEALSQIKANTIVVGEFTDGIE